MTLFVQFSVEIEAFELFHLQAKLHLERFSWKLALAKVILDELLSSLVAKHWKECVLGILRQDKNAFVHSIEQLTVRLLQICFLFFQFDYIHYNASYACATTEKAKEHPQFYQNSDQGYRRCIANKLNEERVKGKEYCSDEDLVALITVEDDEQ